MASKVVQLKRYAASQDFFTYCQLMAPNFYKNDRKFLIELCETLEDFMDSDENMLVVNMPPRHGKSRTLSLFCQWL